jgi:hypothetical protein
MSHIFRSIFLLVFAPSFCVLTSDVKVAGGPSSSSSDDDLDYILAGMMTVSSSFRCTSDHCDLFESTQSPESVCTCNRAEAEVERKVPPERLKTPPKFFVRRQKVNKSKSTSEPTKV